MKLADGWAEKLIKAGKSKREALATVTANFEAEVTDLQFKLFHLLITEWASQLKTDVAGNIMFNQSNLYKARQLEATFDRFNELFYRDWLGQFAVNSLQFVQLTADYYQGIGISEGILGNIERAKKTIAERIGVTLGKKDEPVNIIPNSYLDKLLQADQVRQKVATYALNSMSGNKDFATFSKDLKDMVLGADGTEGAMLRYLNQYAYDTYSQTQRTISNIFAENLQMDNWYYHGSLIETSRPFCEDHADTLITQDDVDQFDGEDWAGKIDGVPFLVQAGGYNCRHFLDPVPQEAISEE